VVLQKGVKLPTDATAVTLVVESVSIAVEESFTAACGHLATLLVFATHLAIRTLQTVGIELPTEVAPL